MKILIVSQYFWPENFRVNDLATELADRGHHVTVFTGWPNYPEGKIFEDFSKRPETYRDYRGIEVLRAPLTPRGQGGLRLVINYLSFLLSASLLGPFKLRGREFDAIFVFGASPVTVAVPAIILKYLKRAPVAFWVLDLWPESLSAVGAVRSPAILRAVGAGVKLIYRHCDLILAQSKSFFKGIGRYCEQEKIRYFPSWSEELFSGEAAAPAPEVERMENAFNIVFAGNIGDAQDFPTILDAAERLRERRDIRWIIVGDGRMADWVREQIGSRGLQQSVIMAGRYPLERMPSFFAHADALLVTLKPNEIFAMTIPGKIQTYLSSGLPLLGAIDGEGAAVIRESNAGLACAAGDGAGLAEAVVRMAGLSRAERAAMGAAGKSYYAREFEKSRAFDNLEHLLRSMRGTAAKRVKTG